MCEHASIAVRKCPFLAQLAKEQGEEYATSFAIAPNRPAGSGAVPEGIAAVASFSESYALFHGPDGLLPLDKGPHKALAAAAGRAGCPFHAQARQAPADAAAQQTAPRAAAVAAPFATISLSNFGKGPNFGDFLRKQFNSNKPGSKPQQRPQRGSAGPNAGKPPHGPASTSSGAGSGGGPLGSSSSNPRPQRPLGDPGVGPSGAGRGFTSSGKPPGAAGYSTTSNSSSSPTLGSSGSSSASASARAGTPTGWTSSTSSSGSVRGPSPFQQQRLGGSGGSGGNSGSRADSKGGRAPGGRSRGPAGGAQRRITGGPSGSSSTAGAAGSGTAPGCPLRKWLGPMAGLVFNQYDKLVCPPPIVAARAALAQTSAVQTLRPQALPVKLVAVAAVVAGVNLPCGAVREHFEKFSLGWFVAVHATIPFVAMLRKAVIMPKYAMLVTIAAAVMGQLVGSRIERLRLQHEQQHGPLLPQLQLQLALPFQLQQQGQEEEEEAGARQRLPRSGGSAHNTSRSSMHETTGRSEQRSSGGRNWREKLAADPEPSAGGVGFPQRCGDAVGGLIARLPMVRA